MKHVILLTKSYNFKDLEMWIKYYSRLNWCIHLINNESFIYERFIKITLETNCGIRPYTYEYLAGWANQWQLFSDILNTNKYNFNKDDIIAFLDDDEFLWSQEEYQYRAEHYTEYNIPNIFEESILKYHDEYKINNVLVPQILMSQPECLNYRGNESYINTHFYRRDDKSAQGKSIIVYDPNCKYSFTDPDKKEDGHSPLIDNDRTSIVIYKSKVGISHTTYGESEYDSPIRLYHYHIKSQKDWFQKYKRGSAAVDHQWYDADTSKNKYYGNYNILDFTMLNTLKLLNIHE